MNSIDQPAKQASSGTPARRMGPSGSPTWNLILDAAEAILQEEGYAALNSKRIAERAGIKRQLVYYYFKDNDDLYVQLFDRLANQLLERMKSALESDNPLRETWDGGIYNSDATIMAEFTALANRSEPVRETVLNFVATARKIQVAALVKAFENRPMPKVEISPDALAIMASSVALTLRREASVGFTDGHQDILAVIQQFLAQAETPR